MKFFKKISLPYIISVVLLLGLAGVLAWQYRDPLLRFLPTGGGGNKGEGSLLGEKGTFSPDDKENQTYQPVADSQENFTFQYPKKFNVTEQPLDGGGKKLLVESNEPKKGFEVTILPFDEPGPLTVGRILQDLPEMKMENVKNVVVGEKVPFSERREPSQAQGIPALAFNSTDENIGDTHEVWFVYNGFLYEALTYPEFGQAMEEILKTWRFK